MYGLKMMPHATQPRRYSSSCKTNFADFWPADFWPPLQPIPLTHWTMAVWGILEQATNKTSHPNIDSLKAAIIKEWDNLSEDFIVKSCRSFRHRIETAIANNGGHIE